MDLKSLRSEIDEIDSELIRLFTKRMEICKKVALYKKKTAFLFLTAAVKRFFLQRPPLSQARIWKAQQHFFSKGYLS